MQFSLSAIADDRIGRLRRRISEGTYTTNRCILAETLAALDDPVVVVRRRASADQPVRAAAVAMLQTALAALGNQAMMILQLHFVELLCDSEIAAIMAISEQSASLERKQALRRLHEILSVG